MFASLKSKMVILIVVVMAVTGAGVVLTTRQYVGNAMEQAEEASAQNVLELVALNINGGYKRLVSDKLDILTRLRRQLRDVATLAGSTMRGYITLEHRGQATLADAQAMAVSWLRESRLHQGEMFLIDHAGTIVAHPDRTLHGVSLSDLRDVKGRHLTDVMRHDRLSATGEYAVFSWLAREDAPRTRKMGYFIPLDEWQWTLATVINFRDVEAESMERMSSMLSELQESFSKINIANTGYLFLFDGNDNLLIPPAGKPVPQRNGAAWPPEVSAMLATLKRAAIERTPSIYRDPFSINAEDVKTYVKHFRAFDWYYAVAVPVFEIEAPAESLVTRQSLVIALIFLASLIAAYFLVSKISQPLDKLAVYARALSIHDFTQDDNEVDAGIGELPIKYRDEVGRLAESFVLMRAAVKRNVERAIVSRSARDAAEQASRAKSNFLAAMSHELRTPLNGILGYAQILDRLTQLPPKATEGIRVIRECGDHLLTLINDILDLAKIEAGKMEVETVDFDLDALAQSAASMVRPRAEQKGLRFVCKVAPDMPRVLRGDAKRLRQVLVNLLGNAIKFTESGEVVLRVSRAPDGIRFEVHDTGIGIAPERLENIFEPFARVADLGVETEGTGLGLAISHRVLARLGGTLQVESVRGEGSDFWFSLDLPEGHEVQTATTRRERAIDGYAGPRKRVLIVDDQIANRAVLRGLLGPLGFDCAEAEDGEKAIAMAATFRPHIALMDVIMPGMGGLAATRRLRANHDLDDTAIIALSASVFEEHRARCLQAGCNDFVAKPIEASVLYEKLEALLGLQWTYANELDAGARLGPYTGKRVAPDRGEIEGLGQQLPFDALVALRDAALKGHARGIWQQIDTMVEGEAALEPLRDTLRQQVSQFQFDRIVELCDAWMESAER